MYEYHRFKNGKEVQCYVGLSRNGAHFEVNTQLTSEEKAEFESYLRHKRDVVSLRFLTVEEVNQLNNPS